MAIELQFDLEFTREELEQIIANRTASHIKISGIYTYSGQDPYAEDSSGQGAWQLQTFVETFDKNHQAIRLPYAPCPTPCPKGPVIKR